MEQVILRAPALYKEAVNLCERLVISGVHCVEGLDVLQKKKPLPCRCSQFRTNLSVLKDDLQEPVVST